MMDPNYPEVMDVIRRALEEDIGSGDITTIACIPENRMASGRFIAREPQVIAGTELLAGIYGMRGGIDELRIEKKSGDQAGSGEVLALVRGRARTLLECERVALNFLQRLSGIATLGSKYVQAVSGTRCRILDTRKTTPGLRRLEKMAAAAGGVTNHRMGLFDAILIKNNHIEAAGGVCEAVARARETGLPIEIEVRTQAELAQALEVGASHLLLDNFSPHDAAQHVRTIAGRAKVEISGGITLETARAFAEAGADFVSAGAITHSARAMDISFRLVMA
jgi:nicotinate-nucleotide pyrophosphorylase (carboxylating)